MNEYDVVTVVQGQYAEKKIQVAQWAIRDGKVLGDAKKAVGVTVKLTVERYDAHPELEGERLISDLGASSLPFRYFEIGPSGARSMVFSSYLFLFYLLPLALFSRSSFRFGPEPRPLALQLPVLRLGESDFPVPPDRHDAARLQAGLLIARSEGVRVGDEYGRSTPAAIALCQSGAGDLGNQQPVAAGVLHLTTSAPTTTTRPARSSAGPRTCSSPRRGRCRSASASTPSSR